jgi:outer membrane protein assembly factor BamB
MSERFWCTLGCLTVLLTLMSACQEAAAPGTVPGDDPATPGVREPIWTFATSGEIWSSPTVSKGVVYFGSDDHFLYAVDVRTHELKWKFETGGLVRSRPAVAKGLVYVTSDNNYLYAVNARTGKLVWDFNLGDNYVPRLPLTEAWDYQMCSPVVADGVVYVGSASITFYALDAKTGEEKWHFDLQSWMRSSPAVADGLVYFGDWRGIIHALDIETGQEIWNLNTYGPVVPSPTVVDGVIYIGSKFPCLFALDARTGEKLWCYEYPGSAPWVESSAAVADGMVYVGSSDWFRVNAIDAKTGELVWYFTTQGDPWCSPAVSDGVVYVGATGGLFYALDAQTGVEKWHTETGDALVSADPLRIDGGVVSSPTIADGVVYYGSLDGKLYAMSTAP